VPFRCQLVLMVMSAYAFGDHVRDPRAFWLRCQNLRALRRRGIPIRLLEDHQ
jgi:hypothetical protein